MDHLAGRLEAASVSDPSSAGDDGARAGAGANTDHLLDVMRAVEGAEATIRNQLEENKRKRLKDELMQKTRQLQMIREDATSQSSFRGEGQERRASVANKMDGSKLSDSSSSTYPRITPILHQNGILESGGPLMQESRKQKYLDSGPANGGFKRSSGEPTAVENGGPSHFSTPLSHSLSPTRKGENDSRLNLAGQG